MPLDIKPLTALRFFAAMWVVCFHYWPELAGGAVPSVVQKGYLGVELFFVLSGFILCHVYLQALGEGRFRYGAFILARIARVYPLHLATLAGVGALAVAATLVGHAPTNPIADWASLPANLLMVHAWGLAPEAAWNHPSWSISAEWFAYLSFPAFAWVAWRLKDRPVLAVAGALTLLFVAYTAFRSWAGFPLTLATIHWGALRIVPCFAYGCAVYLVWRAGGPGGRNGALIWAGAFTLAALTLSHAGGPDAAIVASFGGLILALAVLARSGSGLLSWRAGVYLGEISYAVYMVCFPWQLLFVNGAKAAFGFEDGLPFPFWAVLMAGVIPLAALLHHLVERPARTAIRRWGERGLHRPSTAAAE